MTVAERELRRMVEVCLGDYYRHLFCDFCPLMYVIDHYDEETGEFWEEFKCLRLEH